MSDSTAIVLSHDYELFFDKSGSLEQCLYKPCDALVAWAAGLRRRMTFFVDATMILKFDEYAGAFREMRQAASDVRRHVESLHKEGHEIALHVHPHWLESRWSGGSWDFSGARYALRQFSQEDIAQLIETSSRCLADLAGAPPAAFRAGGFCVEPFHRLSVALSSSGITIDSSVVPGAFLNDPDRGYDFRDAPDDDWWLFERSPMEPTNGGPFTELPITACRLPAAYYWRRLWQRMRGASADSAFGDGTSRPIGARAVLGRLAGLGRVSELSIDSAKAPHLRNADLGAQRRLWHIMGHPKLLSLASLEQLDRFVLENRIGTFETVSSAVASIAARQSR